ncbi:MAG: GDP-mannose 4,6-dehydratase [Candidatus Yanofskybacteria bacterium]|nr:GDP-mannose 4,6-dehydratase [Candidatus Yanofskybacteria bacterium]
MKKVLITGGTGFVGSNFVYKFLELKDEVHLLVRPEAKFWRIEPVKNRVKLHNVDITKENDVEKFISELKPDFILHFATYGAYQGIQQDVGMTVQTNVLGTINLLRACAKTGFSCFINTGSSSEYGEKDHAIREDEILEPNNLYGVTKAAATMYAHFLAKKENLPLVTMRLFSVFGPYEEPVRLMPALVRAALRGERFEAPSPSIVRDFIFIEDVIGAYLKAIERIDSIKGQIFNIASGEEHSIRESVETVEKISDIKIEASYGKVLPRQEEPKMWVADITKAKTQLNWKPTHSFSGGLSKFITWTRENNLTTK